MHVEFGNMARELGVRPDALRILLGIPTRLQKLVRSAKTFEEILSLVPEFREESGSRSCGPKFEDAEKEEYYARRRELFPAYLDKFTTVESFNHFGRDEEGRIHFNRIYLLSSEEMKAGARKLAGLFHAQIEEANSLAEGRLEALVAIYESREEFFRDYYDAEGVSAYGARESLLASIRKALFVDLLSAQAQGVEEIIAVIQKLGKHIERHTLEGRGSQSYRIWEEVHELQDILRLEEGLKKSSFLDEDAVEKRVAHFIPEAMAEIKNFIDSLTFAKRFAKRDGSRASVAYSVALIEAVGKAKTEAEVETLYATWEARRQGNYDRDSRWLETPQVIIDKWDEFFLEKTHAEENLEKLAAIRGRSPGASHSYEVATHKLRAHFNLLLAEAKSEEEVALIDKQADALSKYLSIASYDRKNAIRHERHAEKVRTLWDALERGDELEKAALIGLFHEFRDKEPEKARKALLALAKHFPAESVEEVAVTQ